MKLLAISILILAAAIIIHGVLTAPYRYTPTKSPMALDKSTGRNISAIPAK